MDATEYDMGKDDADVKPRLKISPGCLLLHDRELNHHQHSWGASNDFCNELGNNTRLVEIHTPEQKEALTMILSQLLQDIRYIMTRTRLRIKRFRPSFSSHVTRGSLNESLIW